MKQNESFTYEDFYESRLEKPGKTVEEEIEVITRNLNELVMQHDYDSINLLKKLSGVFCGEDTDAGYKALFTIENYLRMDSERRNFITKLTNLFSD